MTILDIDAPIVLREQIEADGSVSRVEAWLATDGDESKQQIVISETDTRLSWGGTLRLGFDAKGELVRLVVDGYADEGMIETTEELARNADYRAGYQAGRSSVPSLAAMTATDALIEHSDRVHDAMVEFFRLHPCSASGHTECTAKWELIQATGACHYQRQSQPGSLAESRTEGHKEGYLSRVQDEQVAAAAPLNAMTAERDALAEDYEALAATPAHVLDVLILSWAIDEHAQAVPPEEPVHNGGTCSDDCAGDIRARYARLSADEEGGDLATEYAAEDEDMERLAVAKEAAGYDE